MLHVEAVRRRSHGADVKRMADLEMIFIGYVKQTQFHLHAQKSMHATNLEEAAQCFVDDHLYSFKLLWKHVWTHTQAHTTVLFDSIISNDQLRGSVMKPNIVLKSIIFLQLHMLECLIRNISQDFLI